MWLFFPANVLIFLIHDPNTIHENLIFSTNFSSLVSTCPAPNFLAIYLFLIPPVAPITSSQNSCLFVRVVKVLHVFLLGAFIMEGLTGNMAPGRL